MELIDRDKAVFELCRIVCGSDRDLCVSHPKNCCRPEMKNFYKIATVDTHPIVHAHWIDRDHGYQMCSNCFEECCENSEFPFVTFEYCPFCGAKMDKRRDNNGTV